MSVKKYTITLVVETTEDFVFRLTGKTQTHGYKIKDIPQEKYFPHDYGQFLVHSLEVKE